MKYLSLKTLFKEAFLTLFIPHKTFARIPKNPNLNYRQIVPLLFLAGFLFAAVHLVSVHRTLAFVTGRTDYAILLPLPFFSLGNWILGSLSFFWISKFFRKNVPLRRIEVAMFYIWFAWLLMPAFDLLHPILRIPFHLGMLWGAQVHFSWFYIFPILAIESYFLLKNLLKISGKKTVISLAIAASVPFLGRFLLEQIPPLTHQILASRLPNLLPSDFHILITIPGSGVLFCLWLAQKNKYGTLKTVAQTALICLLLFSVSTSAVFFAPFPYFPGSPETNTTVIANITPGNSRFTNSYTFTSADVETTNPTTDNGTVAWQWFSNTYTGSGLDFDFTPYLRTISDIKVEVNVSSVTDRLPSDDTAPLMQGCYSATSGNYYCGDWVNITATGTQTYTISPSAIRTYSAGTNGNQTSGEGAAGAESDWNTLVGNMAATGNKVIVHVLTDDDGGATPLYDGVHFNSVKLIVDYRTTLSQSDWRWYENIDAIQPTTALASSNTAIINTHRNDVIRLRMVLYSLSEGVLAGPGLPPPNDVSEQAFTLQYAQMVGADCVGGDETWADVGAIGATTAAWRGYNNTGVGVTDGTQISGYLVAGSSLESYEEENSSVSNPAGIANGDAGEWDWVIQNYLADRAATYCFQIIAGSGVDNVTPYTIPSTAYYMPKLTTSGEVVSLRGNINIRGNVNFR